MIEKYIRYAFEKSSFLHMLYIKYSYLKYAIKLNLLFNKISVKKRDVKNLPDLKKEARIKKNSKRSKVVHIIGSGWSLNKSVDIVDKSDFVIGFNFSPLSMIDHDIYFIEFGGYKVFETSNFHRILADDIVIPSGGNVYFKNIWHSRNDIQYIKNYIKGKYPLIKDYLVPFFSEDHIRQCLEICLKNNSNFLAQKGSTAISSVFLAYFFDFKEIVLHGIDFGGGYFFEQEDFNGYTIYKESAKKCMYNKNLQEGKQLHPTAAKKVGIKTILPILNKILYEKGVNLYTASSMSPSSKILPIYSKS